MNRIEFIKTLSSQLSYTMKPEEVRELVDYYDEIILDSMEEGLSEEQAISKLDTPDQIIDAIKGTPLEVTLPVSKKLTPYLLLFLVIGFPLWGSLALAACLLVFSLYLLIWCIPLVTGALAFAGIFGGLVSAVLSPFALMDGFHIAITQLGIGLLLFGGGTLISLLTYSISQSVITCSKAFSDFLKLRLFHQRSVLNL